MSFPSNDEPTPDEFAEENLALERSGLLFELSRRRFVQAAGILSAGLTAGFACVLARLSGRRNHPHPRLSTRSH